MDDESNKTAEHEAFKAETETYESASGQPVASPKKKSLQANSGGGVKKFFLTLFILLLLVTIGALAYMWWVETNKSASANSRADQLSRELSEVNAKNAEALKKEQAAEEEGDNISQKSQEENALAAAKAYYCAIKEFGCDKVSATVAKITPFSPEAEKDVSGYAIINAASSNASATGTKLYLKTNDGLEWIVIHEGQSAPPEQAAQRFSLPADYRS